MSGRRVNLPTQDGVIDCYTFEPAGQGPWPAVIVYMDALGIRPEFDQMAQRLADAGYVVVVPNLYYRTVPFTPLDASKVFAGDPAERARFTAMIRSLDNTKVMRDTEAVLQYLDTRPEVRRAPVGALGYCMGGGFAVSALGRFSDRVAAAASFHGGSLAIDAPDSPHLLADRMRGQLYIGVAGVDATFTAAQQERLEEALRAAGVAYTLETYEGAGHGFAVTGHMAYDRAASERHWRTVLELFGSLGEDRRVAG